MGNYLAGLFDGEGWIELRVDYNQHRKVCLKVGLGMQNEDLPNLFLERFGGKVYSYVEKSGKTKWTWVINGIKAEEALTMLASQCKLKNKEAEIALEMITLLRVGKRSGRAPLSDEIWKQRQDLVDKRNLIRSEL